MGSDGHVLERLLCQYRGSETCKRLGFYRCDIRLSPNMERPCEGWSSRARLACQILYSRGEAWRSDGRQERSRTVGRYLRRHTRSTILKTQKATILDDFSFSSFLYREGSFLGASLGQKPNGSSAGQTRPSIPLRGPIHRFVHTIDR